MKTKTKAKVWEPPAHLSERSKRLWAALSPRAQSLGRRALMQTALEALDRADVAREEIAASGLTTTTKTTGALHVHPLVKVEREARAQFAKIWADQLHFHFDTRVDSTFHDPGVYYTGDADDEGGDDD